MNRPIVQQLMSEQDRAQMKNPDRATVSRLTDLPNIGKAMAEDLELIGITHPAQLKGKNGLELWQSLCTISGERHDPCVIDVFMSVVDFMDGGEPQPWWAFTVARKALMEGPS